MFKIKFFIYTFKVDIPCVVDIPWFCGVFLGCDDKLLFVGVRATNN